MAEVHCAWALGSPAGQAADAVLGGVCRPHLQQGPRGRPGPSVQGCPPAVRGSPRWAPVPGVRHPSLAALGRSPTVCLSSPPSTWGSPRGPWVRPRAAQGWGGLPANPGDGMGAAGLSQGPAVPTPALGHVPPIPRGPHGVLSTSVTQTLGCRFGSSSPAMGSAELLWPVGVWSHPPLSPPELASVEGPREPPDQPRTHTRGCVHRQGGLQGWSAGLEPEAACGSLLLMPAGQRPQFRFSRGNGVHPRGGCVASQKHAYNRQPEPLRATDTWPEPDPVPPVRAKTAARPPSLHVPDAEQHSAGDRTRSPERPQDGAQRCRP